MDGERERAADLHMHSTASDGSFTPAEVAAHAHKLGLTAISLTDHDTVDGVAEAIQAGRDLGVEVIPGVELSAEEGRAEVHILGYFMDINQEGFLGALNEFRQERIRRAEQMVDRLRALGYDVSMERVREIAGDGSIGRPHVARALLEKGYVNSIQDAFQRLIGRGGPAYAERYKMNPEQAIHLIHSAGGIAVLAHPVLVGNDEIVERLCRSGLLAGLEASHVEHTGKAYKRYQQMAERHGLVATAGSDCHGPRGKTGILMGRCTVPYECLIALRQAWERAGSDSPPVDTFS